MQELVSMSVHSSRNTGSGTCALAKGGGQGTAVKIELVKGLCEASPLLGERSVALDVIETSICLGVVEMLQRKGLRVRKMSVLEKVSCIRLENPSDDCSSIYQGNKQCSGKG